MSIIFNNKKFPILHVLSPDFAVLDNAEIIRSSGTNIWQDTLQEKSHYSYKANTIKETDIPARAEALACLVARK